MRKLPPLEFQVPESWKRTKKEDSSIPKGQPKILPFCTPYLTQWGENHENYILQQVYANGGILLTYLTICVLQNCILAIRAAESINALQYTIQGHTFAHLRGYGPVPLLEGTYTLQYIPMGQHKVLFTPGVYHYLYILQGPNLGLFTDRHPNIDLLIRHLENLHEEGELAIRLPINKRGYEIINRIQNLSKYDDELGFSMSALVIKLMRNFYRQLQSNTTDILPTAEELPAYVNYFIANRIHDPVPDLMNQIKRRFFIESTTLRNSWGIFGNKSHLGTSIIAPRAILNSIRLKLALFLLVHERGSVSQVSETLQYKSQYHFSDNFRENFGFPPSQAILKVFQ
jgi:AraC-like DNA-binding protein